MAWHNPERRGMQHRDTSTASGAMEDGCAGHGHNMERDAGQGRRHGKNRPGLFPGAEAGGPKTGRRVSSIVSPYFSGTLEKKLAFTWGKSEN